MEGLRREVSELVQRVSSEALERTFRATVAAAPEDTGALIALTDTEGPFMVDDLVSSSTIFCLAEYAEWTDAGSVPHQIHGHPWLAFEWGGVQVVFSQRDGHEPAYVNHPGHPGTRWFNGGEDGGEPMASRWEQALLEAL